MPFPSHSRWFYHTNDTWRGVKIFKIKSSEHNSTLPPSKISPDVVSEGSCAISSSSVNLRTQICTCSCSGVWLSSRIRLHYSTLFYLTLQDTKRRQFTGKQCKDSQESLCHWPRSHSWGLSWPRWPRWGWHEARTRWRSRRRQEGPLRDVSSSRSATAVPVRRRLLWESWSSSLANALSTLVRRDSSVGIATLYGLDGPGIEYRWEARFSAPVQTGPGAHPASYTMGTGSFQG